MRFPVIGIIQYILNIYKGHGKLQKLDIELFAICAT